MTNRRQFLGHLSGAGLLAVAGASMVTLEGCDAWTELESWIPVGLAAFDGVASILDGPFTAIANTVDALWAAVENAVSLYTHTADPTTTVLDKVIAALDTSLAG